MNKHITQLTSFGHHPTQLWIGDQEVLIPQAEHMLQQQFCPENGCTYCTECFKIRMHQHHAITWINPENLYTREYIEPLLHTINYKLQETEQFFFILQNADFLTDSCANALLKSLEEPPAGYRFLLLAARKHMVLPTIRSRCIIQSFTTHEYTTNQQTLFDHFTHTKKLSAIQFLQVLEKSDINEKESTELIDALLMYWQAQVRTAIRDENEAAYTSSMQTLILVTRIAEKPPMPGSSKLFWKNLFLQI